jgi:hypothetical protein
MSQLFPALNKLRHRPGMYIGEPSLTKLAAFLRGYDCARSDLLGKPAHPFFLSFQSWIEQRLQVKYVGWDRAILQQSGSEAEAFKRFWTLFDEFGVLQENGAIPPEPLTDGPSTTNHSIEKAHRP